MNFIDQIVTHIIRPTRQLYRIGKLGPKSFILKSKVSNSVMTVHRQDFPLVNKYKQKIQVSHYVIEQKKGASCPTVIYLHGNNGSRNQGYPYIRNILENEMEVVLFDFAGSGLSEGDFVTLGVKEADDIATVLEYLKAKVRDVFLWGRSMGAVAALIYLYDYPGNIKGVIIDSPFSTLRNLIKQLASTKTGLPQFFFHPVLPFVDKEFSAKTGVTFDDLEVAEFANSIKDCPALFVTSESDQMVKHTHTEAIFKNYQAPKQIEYIKQQHHEVRSKEIVDKIMDFFKRNVSNRDHTVAKQSQQTQQYQPQYQQPQQHPQQALQYQQVIRQNNFNRAPPNMNLNQQRQATNESGKKIRSALIQHPNQRVNSTQAYYQQPQKVSMAYLTKVKPRKDTFFYRQDSNSMEKGSGIRSYSSQYRISNVNHHSTPRSIHSQSVIKYMTEEDGYSKVSNKSIKYGTRR